MHRRTVATFVAVLAMVLAVAGSHAHRQHESDGADVVIQINTMLDQYTQALLKKDVETLDRIWADDLSFINPRGELLSKQNRMDNIKTGSTAFKSIKLSEKQVRAYGQTAVATFRIAIEAQYSGQESSGIYRVMTVWAAAKDRWQMVAVQMTPIT